MISSIPAILRSRTGIIRLASAKLSRTSYTLGWVVDIASKLEQKLLISTFVALRNSMSFWFLLCDSE